MTAWLPFLGVILTICECQIQTQQPQPILPQTFQPGQGATPPQIIGPAATFSQLFVNLLNYKLRWLSQVAGRLGVNSTVTGPGYSQQTTITSGSPNIPQFPINTPTSPPLPAIPALPPSWQGIGTAPQSTLSGNVPGSSQGGQIVSPITQPPPALTTPVAVPPSVGVLPTPLPVASPEQGNLPVTTPEQSPPLPTAPVQQAIGFPPPPPQPTGPAPVSVPVPFQGIQPNNPFSQSSPSPVSIPEPFKTGTLQPPPVSAPLTSPNPPSQSNLDNY